MSRVTCEVSVPFLSEGEMLAERRIRQRAAASAAAEYERLKRERRHRKRRAFRRLAHICLGISAAALIGGLGELRGWICGLIAGMALAFLILARETPPHWFERHMVGAVGEERTAKAIESLLRAGRFMTHDLGRRRFNIDHLLVGPAGVFVLETKNLHGKVAVDGEQATLTRPGTDRPDYHGNWWAREARSHAADANSFFRQRAQMRPWVSAVVVVWADFPQRQYAGDKVSSVHGDDLVTWLPGRPERVRPDQVERLQAALELRSPLKADAHQPRSVIKPNAAHLRARRRLPAEKPSRLLGKHTGRLYLI